MSAVIDATSGLERRTDGPVTGVCSVPECGRPLANKGRGLCHAHEMRHFRGNLRAATPIRAYIPGRGSCKACGNPVDQCGAHGRCSRCLNAWRRAGSPAD